MSAATTPSVSWSPLCAIGCEGARARGQANRLKRADVGCTHLHDNSDRFEVREVAHRLNN